MAADNLKTAFRQPGKVNEDLQEFIMAVPITTTASKNTNQLNITQFKRGVSKYTQRKACVEVSF